MKVETGNFRRWAWLPIPALLAALIAWWALNPPVSFESPRLVMSLSFVFITLASLFVAHLIGRSFLAKGSSGLMLLGCGVLVWGAAGVVNNAVARGDANLSVTIHNTCVWLAALCHLTGVLLASRKRWTRVAARWWIGAAYGLALAAVGLVAHAAVAGWLPLFFVQGQGGTPVRNAVLVSAIAMFVLAALLLWEKAPSFRKDRPALSPFAHWYGLALLLQAVGLLGVMLQPSLGSMLGWTGKAAQYLGGVYMFMAAFESVRESREPPIALDRASIGRRWAYGVAIVAVLAAAAIRLEFFQLLGNQTVFVTFYPAVMLVALYGGLRAGLLAGLLSAGLANYFWMEPAGNVFTTTPAGRIALAIFLLNCAIISAIAEAMRRAQLRAASAEAAAGLATERQRSAHALQASETRYRNLVEVSPDGIIVHQNGRFVFANPAALRLYGAAEPADLLGRMVLDLIPAEDRDLIRSRMNVARDIGRSPLREVRALRLDGGLVHVESIAAAVEFEGRPAVQVVLRDITDRKRAEEKLSAQQRELQLKNSQLQALFDYSAASLALFDATPPYTVLAHNTYYQRLWAEPFRSQGLVGKNLLDYVPRLEADGVLQVYDEVVRTRQAKNLINFPYDGMERGRTWWNWHLAPVLDGGKVIALAHLGIDVTNENLARLDAERRAREAEEGKRILDALMDYLPEGITIASAPDVVTVRTSRYGDDLLADGLDTTRGLTMGDWLGRVEHFLPDGVTPATQEDLPLFRAVKYGETVVGRELILRKPDGVLLPVLCNAGPIRDKEGTITGGIVAWRDISERKRAEEAVRQSEERLQFALETIHTGAWDLDLVDHTAFRSREHDRIFGYPEMLPQWTYEMFIEHVLPEDRAEVDAKFGRAIATRSDWDFECRIRRADGEIRWIRAAGHPRADSSGNVRRMAGVVQDITESKQTGERLRQSADALQAANASLKDSRRAALNLMNDAMASRRRAEQVSLALQQREDQLRIFVEFAPAAIAMLDKELRYVAVSRRWLEDYGLAGQDVLGQSHYAIFPETSERWKEIHRRCLAGAVERAEEDLLERADGSRQWLRWEIRPWNSAPDTIGGIVIFSEDITSQKAAGQALRESEERYRSLFNGMTEGFAIHELITDANGEPADYRYIDVNPAFERLTGLKREAVVGKTVLEALPNTEPVWIQTFGKVALTGEPAHILDYSAAIQRYFEVLAFRPAPMQFAVIFMDVTERKRSEARIARLTRLYAVHSHVNESIVRIHDEKALFAEVCRIVAEDGGFPLVWIGELKDRLIVPVASFGPAVDYLTGMRVEVDGPFGQGPTGTAIREGRAVINADFAANSSATPWRQAALRNGFRASAAFPLRRQGKPDGVLSLYATEPDAFDDEQVRLLDALSDNLSYALDAMEHEHLRTEAEEYLRRAAEELARSNVELEQFAHVTSHDLKEPLRMVTGFMGLLKERYGGRLDAEADEYIEFASSAATRMQGLIDDLLAYARVGRSRANARIELGKTLELALANLQASIEESGAVITREPLPTLWGNEMELMQVFQNLIGNAIKFRRPDVTPEVRIRAEKIAVQNSAFRTGEWRFAVSDNGIGIEPRYHDKLFAIFQRLHTREEYPGSGVGLAICKKIVERHGGRIWVESEAGKGSTFFFTLNEGAET